MVIKWVAWLLAEEVILQRDFQVKNEVDLKEKSHEWILLLN
ncbi:hypothetical protein [Psychromonas ingrahamii]|nr:hypothetical protein [Psychromonas ingrahamii]